MKYLIIIAASSALWSASAFSQTGFMDGNELLTDCTARIETVEGIRKRAQCQGFIMGVTDGLSHEAAKVCVPSNIVLKQAEDIVVNYLSAHPEGRHYSAVSLAFLAFQAAFPCN